MTAIKGITAAFLAAACSLAAAETIYKYERPDGKTVYSDSPVKGAKLVEQLDFPAAPPARRAAAPAPRSAVDDVASSRSAVLDQADARIKAAAQALKEAEERQQQGIEPLPGERMGTASGKSRLAPRYFSRQRDNAADVDAARANLDEAYRLRNDVRD